VDAAVRKQEEEGEREDIADDGRPTEIPTSGQPLFSRVSGGVECHKCAFFSRIFTCFSAFVLPLRGFILIFKICFVCFSRRKEERGRHVCVVGGFDQVNGCDGWDIAITSCESSPLTGQCLFLLGMILPY
jgi:hypothetical protein